MLTCQRLLLILFSAFCALVVNLAYAEEDVTIRQSQNSDDLIEQYRDNGFVYAVKVKPEKGVPYYLVRSDGTEADFIRTDQPDMLVPSWHVLSW